MTNILSAISGQFGKSIILGTFIPVILFITLGLIFLLPLFPADLPLLIQIKALDIEWKAAILFFATILLSGLIYSLNTPLIRFYEGYTWESSWFGELRKRKYRAAYRASVARWTGMRTLLLAMDRTTPEFEKIRGHFKQSGLIVNVDFPDGEALILPTALGNTIRSFESYPFWQYGMDGFTFWPRLIAVIDKEYAGNIDDAKTSFDFTLNCSVLSTTLSLGMLTIGLRHLSFQASPDIWLPWLLKVFVFAVMAYWFYFLTIGRAKNWGIMFKGAFDLYRLELLKRMGYTRKPATLAMERFLWRDIFQQMVFGDSPTIPLAQFDLKTVFAMPKLEKGLPVGGHMETARGISVASNNGSVVVTLKIKNVDARERNAQAVIVIDTIPEGFAYQWNSVWRFNSADPVEVVGTNPIQFQIGNVPHGQTALVHYRIAPIKSAST